MPRPSSVPLNSSNAAWVDRFNTNAQQLLDAPLPLAQFVDLSALNTARDARLNADCLCLVGSSLFTSNGTSWVLYREQLDFVADVIPLTVLLSELLSLHNDLLTDMQSKGWMV
jgi:hypothetical protein